MAFLIGGANTLDTGAYEVANSCRINDDDSAYMTVTPGSNSADRTALTISTWVKRGKRGAINTIFDTTTTDSGYINFVFNAADQIDFAIQNTDYASAPTTGFKERKKTNRLFRDCSAWYHIVIEVDTTESTETDRLKIWVNGTRETSWNHETNNTDQNQVLPVHVGSTSHAFNVGRQGNNTYFFDGYLAEFCYIDGTAYTPTSFGEFDEDSPTIWKPIDVSGLTFGTNGFYLDFEASGNLGNDANGGTDLTEVNLAATDQATDTPTNNFATLNPLNYSSVSKTYAEGNTALTVSNGDDWNATQSNFSVRNGKWYWEVKITAIGNYAGIGVGFNPFNSNATAWLNSTYLVGEQTGSYGWRNNGARPQGGGALSTYTTNDILSIAMDMDNQKVYFAKNGTWEDSGDPTSGATGTGSIGNLTANEDYLIVICPRGSAMHCNFGNPAFTISSGNADADGYGNFEYAVPSGYYALCTKNLATYG